MAVNLNEHKLFLVPASKPQSFFMKMWHCKKKGPCEKVTAGQHAEKSNEALYLTQSSHRLWRVTGLTPITLWKRTQTRWKVVQEAKVSWSAWMSLYKSWSWADVIVGSHRFWICGLLPSPENMYGNLLSMSSSFESQSGKSTIESPMSPQAFASAGSSSRSWRLMASGSARCS